MKHLLSPTTVSYTVHWGTRMAISIVYKSAWKQLQMCYLLMILLMLLYQIRIVPRLRCGFGSSKLKFPCHFYYRGSHCHEKAVSHEREQFALPRSHCLRFSMLLVSLAKSILIRRSRLFKSRYLWPARRKVGAALTEWPVAKPPCPLNLSNARHIPASATLRSLGFHGRDVTVASL